ncbi:MAG: hypothetical protein ACREB8_02400 [Pseudolabrys sp.]
MHLAMKALRLTPESFWSLAPNVQVSIFCSLVSAEAGGANSSSGSRLMTLRIRSIGIAPLRIRKAGER